MKLSLKILTLTGCVLFAQSIGRAQEADEFRSVLSGFSIKLPRTLSAYRNVAMEVAKNRFPTRIYRWNRDDETFTVWVGDAWTDLENPKDARLFLDDFPAQYVASVKDIKILDEHSWSFEGHPGFELIEEHNGRLIDLRIFLTGYRFYALIANEPSAQHKLGDRQQQIIASFHLFSSAELAEEKERLIASFAPAPLPQNPAIRRPLSDAQEQNLRDQVKRVLIEEANYFGQPQPTRPLLVSRSDFDDQGYLVTRIEYSDLIPATVSAFGYLNGDRAYRKALRPPLPEFTLSQVDPRDNPKNSDSIFKVSRRYDRTTGALEEMTVTGPGGALERWSYKDEKEHRRIELTKTDQFGLTYRRKTVLDLDGDENPIAELKTEYFPQGSGFGPGSYVSVERPVNDYDVVSQAIKGQPITSSTGNRNITATDVAKNPNQTQRAIQTVRDNNSRQTNLESKFIYKYEEYDSHHNWTRRVAYVLKKESPQAVPVSITYRTITYY